MHRVVIFQPVTSNGQTLYGRLYGGQNEDEILITARIDYKTLLIREEWEGKEGESFREHEGWSLIYNEDGTESWWSFDENKYTYLKGYDPIPDQFVQQLCNPFAQYIALISEWVPLRFADTDNEDYIINGAFYDMVANAANIQWTRVDEPVDDELPF